MEKGVGAVAAGAAPHGNAARGGHRPLVPVLLLPAAIAMLAGLDAALVLLGLPAPVTGERLAAAHGMLLVLGFVGALIALERAVAWGRPAGFAAPALLGLGGLLLISPAPLPAAQGALLCGAAALVGIYVPLWRRQRDVAVLAQALGAVLAVGAAILWWGGVPVAVVVPWLVGFLVLTIAGERVELARVAMGPDTDGPLVGLAGGVVAGVVSALLWPAVGFALLGAALLTVVGWLAAHDVARRTVRATGQARFAACAILAGYLWLAVAAATWLLGGPALDGPRYDVVVHSVFLGFTLSMIMAHAPVILPAVLRVPVRYHPALFVPVALLQLSLVGRLALGDGLGVRAAWQVGGALNVAAVLLFLVLAAASAIGAARSAR